MTMNIRFGDLPAAFSLPANNKHVLFLVLMRIVAHRCMTLDELVRCKLDTQFGGKKGEALVVKYSTAIGYQQERYRSAKDRIELLSFWEAIR